MLAEGFRDRGRWRDGIPGRHRGAAIDAAKARRVIAADKDAIAHFIGALDFQPAGAGQIVARMVVAHAQRLMVGRDQRVLALVLLADQLLQHLDLDAQKLGQRADIDDVLEQLALARIAVGGIADLRQRHAQDVDVVAEFRRRDGAGGIVEQITAGIDRGDILVPGLGVHRHHQVHAAAPAQPAMARDPHFVPGGKALDVGGEDVARSDRHAHAQNGAGEHLVRRRRTRAIDVGELHHKVIDGFYRRHAYSVLGAFSRNFCMSQAPVGQRSAQSPQCRHRSSSLTMTRPVLSPAET